MEISIPVLLQVTVSTTERELPPRSPVRVMLELKRTGSAELCAAIKAGER
jgi:hypothetical protein